MGGGVKQSMLEKLASVVAMASNTIASRTQVKWKDLAELKEKGK